MYVFNTLVQKISKKLENCKYFDKKNDLVFQTKFDLIKFIKVRHQN